MPKERQTCTECSMRRQKCDRQLPCSRCIKRGEPNKCTRQWPQGGYNPRIHRHYPSSEQKSRKLGQKSPQQVSPTPTTNASSDFSLQTPLHSRASISSSSGHVALKPQGSLEQSETHRLQERPGNGADDQASTLEIWAWGKTNLSDYDLRSVRLADESTKDPPELDISTNFGGVDASQMAFLQLLLPNKRRILQLVEYHIDSALWYHSCFHGPLFSHELRQLTQGPNEIDIRKLDPRWTALLFSIMAGSLSTAPASVSSSWGFNKEERHKLTRQWFKATLTCLNLSDYMLRHHIHSVEAILVLVVSAHLLGYSTTMTTLLGAGLKIALGLGFHKLESNDEHPKYAHGTGRIPMIHPVEREKIIYRERGRRVWLQLCIQDWLSLGCSEMYSIQRRHFTTTKPLSINDHTLEMMPPDIPTPVLMSGHLFDLANVCVQMFDAVYEATTTFTKYEAVLQHDAKMRAVADDMPKWLDSREAIEPQWPVWVPWARRSFNLCFYHKIILAHRRFLGRSFRDPAFTYSRQACLAASKSILKEAKQAYDEEGPSFWIDQAFMVAAGIILTLDVFHRQEFEPEYSEHRRLAESSVSMLRMFENSAIGQLGVKMLASLLTEEARLHVPSTFERSRRHSQENGMVETAPMKMKFDVPKFVEQFVRENPPTRIHQEASQAPSSLQTLGSASSLSLPTANYDPYQVFTPGLEKFEELFPPHSGISNSFLFDELLNFDI